VVFPAFRLPDLAYLNPNTHSFRIAFHVGVSRRFAFFFQNNEKFLAIVPLSESFITLSYRAWKKLPISNSVEIPTFNLKTHLKHHPVPYRSTLIQNSHPHENPSPE
jgi:hypothetical protein